MTNIDWPDVGRRIGRQTVQVLGPALVAIAAGQHGVSWDVAGGLVLIAAIGAAVTALKGWAGLATDARDPWAVQASERAASAVVAVLAGYTFAGPLTDLLALPWATIGWSCVGAAGIAVAAMITNRPQPARFVPVPVPDDAGAAEIRHLMRTTLVLLAGAAAVLAVAVTAPQAHAAGCPPVDPHKPWTQLAHDTCLRQHWHAR